MKTRAAEETRSGEITFDDFEDQSVNGVTPEQKKLFLGEMLHIIEMDLPYIGV